MSFFGGLSGFASGFIRKAIGYNMLSNVSTILAGFLMVYVIMTMASPRESAVAA
jgi:formate hydrogenlyase subunit 3/multisubunit Na+/H+ antiporter MnhD subunit